MTFTSPASLLGKSGAPKGTILELFLVILCQVCQRPIYSWDFTRSIEGACSTHSSGKR
jgi:hypothetical protein